MICQLSVLWMIFDFDELKNSSKGVDRFALSELDVVSMYIKWKEFGVSVTLHTSCPFVENIKANAHVENVHVL